MNKNLYRLLLLAIVPLRIFCMEEQVSFGDGVDQAYKQSRFDQALARLQIVFAESVESLKYYKKKKSEYLYARKSQDPYVDKAARAYIKSEKSLQFVQGSIAMAINACNVISPLNFRVERILGERQEIVGFRVFKRFVQSNKISAWLYIDPLCVQIDIQSYGKIQEELFQDALVKYKAAKELVLRSAKDGRSALSEEAALYVAKHALLRCQGVLEDGFGRVTKTFERVDGVLFKYIPVEMYDSECARLGEQLNEKLRRDPELFPSRAGWGGWMRSLVSKPTPGPGVIDSIDPFWEEFVATPVAHRRAHVENLGHVLTPGQIALMFEEQEVLVARKLDVFLGATMEEQRSDSRLGFDLTRLRRHA